MESPGAQPPAGHTPWNEPQCWFSLGALRPQRARSWAAAPQPGQAGSGAHRCALMSGRAFPRRAPAPQDACLCPGASGRQPLACPAVPGRPLRAVSPDSLSRRGSSRFTSSCFQRNAMLDTLGDGGLTPLESARNSGIGHFGVLHLNTKGRLGRGPHWCFFFSLSPLPINTECWQALVPRLFPLQREFAQDSPGGALTLQGAS